MSTYPKNGDPELLKFKTKYDQLSELQNKTKKHDNENILKSIEIDDGYYKKKYKSLNENKVLLVITQVLIGSGSAIGTSTMSIINPSIVIVLTSPTALLTSIAMLITNEYISKLKIRYAKLRDWIIGITLLYEKTLKTPMVDKKMMKKMHRN